MGASILPIAVHNNKIYLLFGKEKDSDENKGWSDFGGGTEKGESFLNTAIREGAEELTGFLGNPKTIEKLLKKYGYYNIDYKSDGFTTYRVHIFPIEYDEKLPFYFNNNAQFVNNRLDENIMIKSRIFEKQEIKWFCLNDLYKYKKEFRLFYQNIIDLILLNKKNINNFIRDSIKKSKNKTVKNKS